MTTARGEITRGTPDQLHDQLVGKVWLAQVRGQWPISVLVSESQVVTWLKQNPTGVAWEYQVTPVRRVEVVTPEPFLAEHQPKDPTPCLDDTQRLERVQR